MEIKVGQIWECRGGRKVTIIRKILGNSPWHWQGDSDTGVITSWTDEGKYWTNGSESILDLIKLVKDVEPKKEFKMKIEVGQKWKLVNGETVTVVGKSTDSIYPWRVSTDVSIETYTDEGRYTITDTITGGASPYDMESLISEPKMYSREELENACYSLGISSGILFTALDKISDFEYKEYLRLKEKFE